MSSFRARIIRSLSSFVAKRIDVTRIDIVKSRRRINSLCRLLWVASGVKVRRDEVCGLAAEWLTPDDAMEGKLLLYLHGGGYVIGGCDMHRQTVSHIARAGRIKALLPEYRLAPENKFPAAVEDAVAIYRSLLESGQQPDNIVIAGDSAGGGLSVATLLALRDAGEPLPAAAVLLSPFLDVTGSGDSMRTRAAVDPWFTPEELPFVADLYCAAHQQRFPQVSPVFADVEGLPPMLIQVGDHEILLSDAQRLADECVAAGINVELEVWPEMWHVFQMFIGKMPEARQAVDKIGAYIQARWDKV